MRHALNRYVSLRELADVSGYTQRQLRRLIKAGEIPAHRPSRRWLIAEPDAKRWLDGATAPSSEAPDAT